jgi:hypothetical protein
MNRHVYRAAALCIFTILTYAFVNDLGIGSKAPLEYRGFEGEPKIYGRLALSRQDGPLSQGGLLGGCGGRQYRQDTEYQLARFNEGTCSDYLLYKSQNAGQAVIYYALDLVWHTPIAFRLFCAFISAGALVSMWMWVQRLFGTGISLLFLADVLFSRGLVIFADNVSQVVGMYFVLLAALLWAYEKKSERLWLITFAVFFVKCVLTGYEYMITAGCIALVPLVFYAVRDRFDEKRIKRDAFLICSAMVAATVLSLAILVIQIARVDSVSGAFDHFYDRMLARTYFPTENNRPYYFYFMHTPLLEVFWKNLTAGSVKVGAGKVTFLHLIMVFAAATALAFADGWKKVSRDVLALSAATWFSVLGAIGWILIMKGHSATHWFIDPMIWHIPFTLLGTVLTGQVLNERYRTI